MKSTVTIIAAALLLAGTAVARADDDDHGNSGRGSKTHCVTTFGTGWSNYADFFNDPTYEKVCFFKDASGVVHLQGLAFNAFFWTVPVEPDGSTIFVLPHDFRPAGRVVVVGAGNCQVGNTDVDGKCRVDILANGRVTLNDTLPSVLSLTSITFRAKHR